MLGLNRLGYFLAQLRKKFGKNTFSCEPLPVPGFEKFLANDALGIDEKISGARKSLLHPRSFWIKNPVGPDGFRIGIPQQGIFDLVPVSKELQNFLRVIADGSQLDPLLLESHDGILQLNQLPFAER